jgi:hypothetical protein
LKQTAQPLPTPQNQIPPTQKYVIRNLFLLLDFIFTSAILPYKDRVGCREVLMEKLESVEVKLMTWRNILGTSEIQTTSNNDGTIRTVRYPQNITRSRIKYVGELLKETPRIDGRECSIGEVTHKTR